MNYMLLAFREDRPINAIADFLYKYYKIISISKINERLIWNSFIWRDEIKHNLSSHLKQTGDSLNVLTIFI